MGTNPHSGGFLPGMNDPSPKRVHGLREDGNRQYPVVENMPLQRIFWRVERCGWGLLLAVIAVHAL